MDKKYINGHSLNYKYLNHLFLKYITTYASYTEHISVLRHILSVHLKSVAGIQYHDE